MTEQEIVTSYCQEIKKIPLLPASEQYELAKLKMNGDMQAREKLIKHNMRWVLKVAFQHKARLKDVSFLDLIQWGMQGLIHAVDKYEPQKAKLTTYAYWWIRAYISRGYSDTKSAIRIPVHIQDKMMSRRKFVRSFFQEHGRKPSLEEISEGTGLKQGEVKRTYEASDLCYPLSIDMPLGPDSQADKFLKDIVADDSQMNEPKINGELCQTLLALLTPKQRQAVEIYYGFDGNGGNTCRGTAAKMGKGSDQRISSLLKSANARMARYLVGLGYDKDVLAEFDRHA